MAGYSLGVKIFGLVLIFVSAALAAVAASYTSCTQKADKILDCQGQPNATPKTDGNNCLTADLKSSYSYSVWSAVAGFVGLAIVAGEHAYGAYSSK